MKILLGYILSIAYAAACLLIARAAYALGAPREYTRKGVHIAVGLEWAILYAFMGAGGHFFAVCVGFFLLLTLAYFEDKLPVISSGGDNAPGTVYYALSMSVMAGVCAFLPSLMLPFGIAVVCTSLGDGAAGLIGRISCRANPKIFGQKTLFGTLACFAFSLGGICAFNSVLSVGLTFPMLLCIAALAAETELVSTRGLDNITVPLSTCALAYLFTVLPTTWGYMLPIMLTPLISGLAIRLGALTVGGLVAALAVDVAVSVTLGNGGFLVLLFFLVAAVVADKLKHRYRPATERAEKKGARRDAYQVLANGLVPAAFAIAYAVSGKPVFAAVFVASVAEAMGDTLASGVGAFSRGTFDLFRWKKCDKGLSGGMSVIGTVAAVIGSAAVCALSYTLGLVRLRPAALALVAAVIGVMVDSALGSLLQVKYRCKKCGVITEREEHCGKPTEKYRGLALVDNDLVNLISALVTAAVATLLAVGVR